MSRISDLLYGDLDTLDAALEEGGTLTIQQVACALQNLTRKLKHIEKRLESQEKETSDA